MNKTDDYISKLEAMLFAAGDPVEGTKLAEVLEIDLETVTRMLGYLAAMYDERESGLMLIKIDNKYQLCTREAYSEEVRKLLEIKKNTPLSNAAFEVLAIVAYNKTVTRAFIEQVRGVDCSGPVSSLVQKGLIEEKGRLDLPGRPIPSLFFTEFARGFARPSENGGNRKDCQGLLTDLTLRRRRRGAEGEHLKGGDRGINESFSDNPCRSCGDYRGDTLAFSGVHSHL